MEWILKALAYLAEKKGFKYYNKHLQDRLTFHLIMEQVVKNYLKYDVLMYFDASSAMTKSDYDRKEIFNDLFSSYPQDLLIFLYAQDLEKLGQSICRTHNHLNTAVDYDFFMETVKSYREKLKEAIRLSIAKNNNKTHRNAIVPHSVELNLVASSLVTPPNIPTYSITYENFIAVRIEIYCENGNKAFDLKELSADKALHIPVIGSSTLSICCKKGTTLTNTTNNIKCYKCNNCGKLTGIEDEHGRRLN